MSDRSGEVAASAFPLGIVCLAAALIVAMRSCGYSPFDCAKACGDKGLASWTAPVDGKPAECVCK
jgi:hypothetical protein